MTSPRFVVSTKPMDFNRSFNTAARLPWNMPTPASIPMLNSCWWFTRWWFQIFFIFTPTWGNDPIWLIFSNGLKPPTSLLGCVCWDFFFFTILYPYYHAWTKKNTWLCWFKYFLGITELSRVFFSDCLQGRNISNMDKDRLSSKVPAGRGYVSLSQGYYCLPPGTLTQQWEIQYLKMYFQYKVDFHCYGLC